MGATPAESACWFRFTRRQLVAGPLLGQLSDRTGRKPLLLLSQFGTLVGFIILAYAHVLWVVFVSRIIDGITAGNLSLAQAYIADVTEPENRTKSFAVIGVSFGIGFLIGPAISGFLSTFGYQYPDLRRGRAFAASILATYFLLPSVTPVEARHLLAACAFSIGEPTPNTSSAPALRPALAIFPVRIRLRVVHVGFALFAERRYTWHGNARLDRAKWDTFSPTLGLLGIILQGGLIGRRSNESGEPKLATEIGFAKRSAVGAPIFSASRTNCPACSSPRLSQRFAMGSGAAGAHQA
jgi:MFS family permease